MTTRYPTSDPNGSPGQPQSHALATSPQGISLDQCASEPIHIPGSIQPHGALFSLDEQLVITQASMNTDGVLGMPVQKLLGESLASLLLENERARFQEMASSNSPEQRSPGHFKVNGRDFEVSMHRHEGILIVELEPVADTLGSLTRQHRQLQHCMAAMQAAQSPGGLYQAIADSVSELTGYERVMVYRFDADWHGEVVAEKLTAEVDSYLGLHFPASDIPAQARALYTRSWLRIIPAVEYTPARIEPPLHPATGRPLDLSFAMLRSVSPVHLEYLRNMNVGASMSISLIVGGRLWGLAACHHRTPRALAPSTRSACELLGQIASREIATEQERRSLAQRANVYRIQTGFFEVIAREDNVAEALVRFAPSLLDFMGACGAAVCFGGQCNLLGRTPTRPQVYALLSWLKTKVDVQGVYATESLSQDFLDAADYPKHGSGLLAIRLSRAHEQYILWFRPEVVTTVTWAGNPAKPLEEGARIHPRKSFAAWQETVAGRSHPWNDAELQGALELRLALNAMVIRRTERLLNLNSELERKNSDLNSFAYIASHDLKEPIRGIHHFSKFLLEGHGTELGEDGLRKVNTIAALASHTNDLLAALARFSQLGRMELHLRETSLDKVVDDVLLSLQITLNETNAKVLRPRALPSAPCDKVLVREVFLNLIGNAVKYNERAEKTVEVSWLESTANEEARGPVYYVRDNGIGIRERSLPLVFQMFRRLNKDKYGSGTGAGLAIVKSIVERHGGRIWVESLLGEGSTFYFTLK